MIRDFSDDVNGTIIGKVKIMGKLFHDGRQQGQNFFHETEEGLVELSNAYIQHLKDDCGEAFWMIYTKPFELRVY